MTETFHQLRDQPVGEIAAQFPGTSAVFRRFGIEFCCQGHVSLADAANHRNLDLNELEKELVALDPAAAPEIPQGTGDLIDYIRSRYHGRHRAQLEDLIELSRKVESVHVNHQNVPAGMAHILRQFRAELEKLMNKQETTHFPALQKKTPDELKLSLQFMRHDHAEFAFFLDQIDCLTDDCTPPEDACASWQALYADLSAFKADLIEHIHLENNVLFPRFESSGRD
ncbi:DUF542 domain-containing protein [Roseovarius sp. SCSIO 43702]|uniref:DUF542 domain-containing protein n=1 Tax=Roseovarius sp. SCSIO 43702 TaxID=2823043 RepID=UPI001C73272D|nr:DUF542 domain-containing protein [Roseovarius sp. SCSIO 43702]QYX57205.1 DUF542 domain-containing protein [Roseovarius sp. SCSIO 43702]